MKEHNIHMEISVITEMEMVVGCRNKTELRKLDKFIKRFHVIQLQNRISVCSTKLLRQYRLSHGLLIPDSLIAATAVVMDIPLVTKNRKDFRFIDGLHLARDPH